MNDASKLPTVWCTGPRIDFHIVFCWFGGNSVYNVSVNGLGGGGGGGSYWTQQSPNPLSHPHLTASHMSKCNNNLFDRWGKLRCASHHMNNANILHHWETRSVVAFFCPKNSKVPTEALTSPHFRTNTHMGIDIKLALTVAQHCAPLYCECKIQIETSVCGNTGRMLACYLAKC